MFAVAEVTEIRVLLFSSQILAAQAKKSASEGGVEIAGSAFLHVVI